MVRRDKSTGKSVASTWEDSFVRNSSSGSITNILSGMIQLINGSQSHEHKVMFSRHTRTVGRFGGL
jgi:hypothetical protein